MKMPSKEQILEASKDCPDAKEVLKKLFPEAFKEEWDDVTKELEIRIAHFGEGVYYLRFSHNGSIIAHSHCDLLGDGEYDYHFIMFNDTYKDEYKIEWSDGDFCILKRRGK